MKNTKIILFASFTLALLVFGQSYGVTAIIDSSNSKGNNDVIAPAAFRSDEAFSVDIFFVGYSSLSSSELTAETDGTYLYETSTPDSLSIVVIKTNVTGYTCWGNCADTDLAGNSTALGRELTFGQLFVIVDGIATNAGNGYMSASGASIGLGMGNHVVTVMYVGYDEADGLVWASDTVVIRVGSTVTQLKADGYALLTAGFDSTLVDDANTTTKINVTSAFYNTGYSTWTNDFTYSAEANLNVGVDGTNYESFEAIHYDFAASDVDISGTINSSGYTGYQLDENHTSTIGHTFVLDATGIRDLAGVTTVSAFNNTFYNATADCYFDCMETVSSTYIGLLVLADYGRWARNGVTYDSWQTPFADFGGLNTVSNTTVNATSGVPDYNGIALDASFDFLDVTDGRYLFATSQTAAEVNVGNTETVTTSVSVTTTLPGTTSTDTTSIAGNTSDSTTSVAGTTSVSTKTEDSPGFGIIVSLLTIGVIAFAAPRLRRVKR